jgi:hypothetical protein
MTIDTPATASTPESVAHDDLVRVADIDLDWCQRNLLDWDDAELKTERDVDFWLRGLGDRMARLEIVAERNTIATLKPWKQCTTDDERKAHRLEYAADFCAAWLLGDSGGNLTPAEAVEAIQRLLRIMLNEYASE